MQFIVLCGMACVCVCVSVLYEQKKNSNNL